MAPELCEPVISPSDYLELSPDNMDQSHFSISVFMNPTCPSITTWNLSGHEGQMEPQPNTFYGLSEPPPSQCEPGILPFIQYYKPSKLMGFLFRVALFCCVLGTMQRRKARPFMLT